MMNNENGLPTQVRIFMEKYLHNDEERALFLETYCALKNVQEQATFLESVQEVPTAAEIEAAAVELEQLPTQLRRNQSN
jgi:hypothetical protein